MASLVRIERFVFKNGMWNYREVVPYSFDWWTNENDNSKQRQEGFFYTLCALYALVAFVALVQLTRIQMRVPGYGWTTQKAFHLMNFVVNGCKRLNLILYTALRLSLEAVQMQICTA
uniref:THH1/TOM1/TOM3 domain-containing protein n=1 Tax=Nelumbo nucifera TaxID=4432 RepID=A0A822XQK1_NELNU|nr:TPA_asm: hypothetical protein HUJ06_023416 [Nelumbo nucifera]